MWKLKGFQVDAFDPTMIVYNIWANTKNDLPSTMTDIGYGTALGFGSTAQTFDDSKEWRWNGTEWVEQNSGQEIEISADDIVYDNTDSGMTATNVQDAIDEIKDTDDMQDRALVELYGENANQQLEINYAINTGAKNKLGNKYAVGTVTETNGFRFTAMEDGGIKIESIGTHNANGDYYILGNWGNTQTLLDLSGDTYTATFSSGTTISGVSLRIFGANNTAIINNLYLNTSRNITDVEVKFAFITVTSTTTLPSGGITVYPMIRNAGIRNSTFEPYAPTNRELYEMILALQSGRSLQSVNTTSTLNLSRNDLNEALDTNFDLLDSIPEEEEGEEDV